MIAPHQAAMRRYATKLCRNESDADDLVQETLAQALANLESLPTGNRMGPWLMVVLYRLFLDQCRRRKIESKAYQGIRHILPTHAPSRVEPPPRWTSITDQALRLAIENLPRYLRLPYVLRTQGRSYREIGEQLDIPMNTVSTRIHRARRALKSIIAAEQENENERDES